MKAMVLEQPGTPLVLRDIPCPKPEKGQVLVKVGACGVCRTDLHIADGELPDPSLPLVLGHQIVGRIVEPGTKYPAGQRVGIPWLGSACGTCPYCKEGRENLCDHALFTGYQLNGGFAEYCVANEDFCFPLPEGHSDASLAPLLCAGLIGYRAYRMCGNGSSIGFYGFGASAHLLTQLAVYEHRRVFAFTRPGDLEAQALAKTLGTFWAGGSDTMPPESLDAAIIFAPVGELVPQALRAVKKGGVVVCAGIHMSPIPSFPYDLLWEERQLRSVANLTRQDGREFLALAPRVPIRAEINEFPLEKANEALNALRKGKITGAVVLVL